MQSASPGPEIAWWILEGITANSNPARSCKICKQNSNAKWGKDAKLTDYDRLYSDFTASKTWSKIKSRRVTGKECFNQPHIPPNSILALFWQLVARKDGLSADQWAWPSCLSDYEWLVQDQLRRLFVIFIHEKANCGTNEKCTIRESFLHSRFWLHDFMFSVFPKRSCIFLCFDRATWL